MAAPLPPLRVYLLGSLDFEEAQRLQSTLVFRLAEDGAALVLCEHPPMISVGRQGGPGQLRIAEEERLARGWPLRWVSRGAGAFLHVPGQLAVYPILPLARLGLSVTAYLDRLHQVFVRLLADFTVQAQTRPGRTGVWSGNRQVAAIGIGVRDGVTTFGGLLNLDPDLTLFRFVHTGGADDGPMTSLARERRGPVRPALVRQRLIEHFAERFGFDRTDVLFHPPGQPGHQRLYTASS
jgi:lipoyl(octanoyl) transferase